MELFTAGGFAALLEVVAINLVLSGDNAIVIGLAAAGLPAALRKKAIIFGISAATVLRLVFAVVATYLLAIKGLQLAGGLLLGWVCWKMWGELREGHNDDAHAAAEAKQKAANKTFFQAATQIVVADVSMSLDNVLAVAGAAKEHSIVLILGLIISIALMGVAANFVAKLLSRFRWIAYVGLAVIVYVALDMIYQGSVEVLPLIQGV
ncbi:YjbE family putative metal transport protein [Neorhizobium galegae]|uniref:YjbE family putative metal transport protein n=1 Tax=Neorhizobium galegae TaxID=399 RepID=UPI00062780A6|nr:YjbE family putative metal transport protein [Neorhizobium galegae]MCQ1765124.1 YjbE family putative metal transport protein [Neorhizobium galegae]MCQ1844037.1 YjbE family putative metal transport protein [Neorhizobium galegae]